MAADFPGWGQWDGLTGESAGCCVVGELRVVKGDDLWLSPFRGRDALGIHITFGVHPTEVGGSFPDPAVSCSPA